MRMSPLNPRTADADRGSLLKGGEEKSPYDPYPIIYIQILLDGKPTLSLRLSDI